MAEIRQTHRNLKKRVAATSPSSCFAPVARGDARILILGSLPGQRSLQAVQYYAHPQNAFWRIMRDLVGADGTYEQRCATLVENGIALWDVLAESTRPGSMDADIEMDTAKANDFSAFFLRHPDIERLCFNGQKAAQMYSRFVDDAGRRLQQDTLPSTSPAYAAMAYPQKLARWRSAIEASTGGM
jgi:TDG/mug DNA glycosylase family protein